MELSLRSIDWEGYCGRQDWLCKGSENATHSLLKTKGTMFKSMGGFQGPPPAFRFGGLWGKSDLRPTLACFQVRSRGIAIEEWKDPETHSPNPAHGKTSALTSAPGDPPGPGHSILARRPIPSSSSPTWKVGG